MAAGDTTPATRLPDNASYEDVMAAAPGAYRLAPTPDDAGAERYLHAKLPNGSFLLLPVGEDRASPPRWELTEHDDGKITLSPSIWFNRGGPTDWHGFLERDVWREV